MVISGFWINTWCIFCSLYRNPGKILVCVESQEQGVDRIAMV